MEAEEGENDKRHRWVIITAPALSLNWIVLRNFLWHCCVILLRLDRSFSHIRCTCTISVLTQSWRVCSFYFPVHRFMSVIYWRWWKEQGTNIIQKQRPLSRTKCMFHLLSSKHRCFEVYFQISLKTHLDAITKSLGRYIMVELCVLHMLHVASVIIQASFSCRLSLSLKPHGS